MPLGVIVARVTKKMTNTMSVKTYSEASRFTTFKERFDYLMLGGHVGESTFGFDRWINQQFYASRDWKYIRNHVIARDEGCDLGIPGFEIHARPLVHHVNPMQSGDILHSEEWILNPEYLITTTTDTHNAIHYGNTSYIRKPYTPRQAGDTKLW